MSNVKDRQIVLPGEKLGEGVRCEGECIAEGDSAYSLVRGLARVSGKNVNIIPSDGAYVPKSGDVVLGVVDRDLGGIYLVDLDGPYLGVLREPRNDRRGPREQESYSVGDLLSAKIVYVDEVKEAQLTGPRKLEEGYVIRVKPMRVPRIIGRKRSMITLIRDNTRSHIIVGQNGLIWLKGGNLPLAVEALRMVEREAQTSGLTDRVTKFLSSKSKKK